MYDWKLKVKRCFQYLDLNKIEIKDGIVDNLNEIKHQIKKQVNNYHLST